MWVEDGGGQNCPDLSALGVTPCPRWAGFSWGRSLTGRPPPPATRQARLPGEHAVGNHGGDPGARLEESQLPAQGGVQTPHAPEPRWDSDSGYVCDPRLGPGDFF